MQAQVHACMHVQVHIGRYVGGNLHRVRDQVADSADELFELRHQRRSDDLRLGSVTGDRGTREKSQTYEVGEAESDRSEKRSQLR